MDSKRRNNTFRNTIHRDSTVSMLTSEASSGLPTPLPRNPTITTSISPTTIPSTIDSAPSSPTPPTEISLTGSAGDLPPPLPTKTLQRKQTINNSHASLHNLAKLPVDKSNSIQSRAGLSSRSGLSSIQSSTTGSEAPLNLSEDQRGDGTQKKKSRKRLCCLSVFSIVLLSTVGILIAITMNMTNEESDETEKDPTKGSVKKKEDFTPPKITLKSSIFDNKPKNNNVDLFALQNDHRCQFFNSSIPGSKLGILHKKVNSGAVIKQQGIWLTENANCW